MSRVAIARLFCCALAFSTLACVRTDDLTIAWDSARFNDRLRGDLHPLTPQDLGTDLSRGFFRDGSDQGLVSPLLPVAASSPSGNGHLVQTPCLFLGVERDPAGTSLGADELRLSWELVGDIDRSAGLASELFVEGYEELGLCSFSSPGTRMLFEDPQRPPRSEDSRLCGRGQGNGSGFALALTLNPDDPASNRNQPILCAVAPSYFDLALDAFVTAPDADGRCPTGAPGGAPQRLDEGSVQGGGALLGDRFAACALPGVGVVPTGDTRYRVSLHSDAPFGGTHPELWFSPAVMHVAGRREIARPLAAAGGGRYAWRTKVDPVVGEGTVRWQENFTPTVRVESVEIVSRLIGGGGEQVVRPASDRLVLTIPRAGGADAIVSCSGRQRNGRFGFLVDPPSGSSDCAFDGPELRALTPTYALSVLDLDPPVTQPIRWEVTVPSLPAGRELFVRFRLVARARGAALRSTAVRNLGPLQVGDWAQGELTLENLGERTLQVTAVELDPTSLHPEDFSWVVVGDPVPVPLPIEGKPTTNGLVLTWNPDAPAQDLLRATEENGQLSVSWGDPRRGAGSESLDLGASPGTLVGGLLLRDDPAARFAPGPGSLPRPFSVSAYAQMKPPFELPPGAQRRIFVTATPAGTGAREARVRVRAIDPASPATPLEVVGVVAVTGVAGPQLATLPASIWIKRDAGQPAVAPSRWALLENVGASPLTVSELRLEGAGASRFGASAERGAPPFVLAAGDSTRVEVTYAPQCDGSYALPDDEASLRIVSNGGSAALPLYGLSVGYCELP